MQVNPYAATYATQPNPYVATATTTTDPVSNNNGNAYGQDQVQNNAPAFDPNTQAGGMKRFMNGMGNAFGRMADWVGLGTISHYAKQNFELYDADKSNSITAPEFTAVGQMVAMSFEQVDQNANQEVSFGEFKKIIGAIVDADFGTLDTSGDGFVNYAEASAGGYVVAHGNSDSFMMHDKNQDSLLSRNEFAGLVNDRKLRKLY